jgi:hypothetical protein
MTFSDFNLYFTICFGISFSIAFFHSVLTRGMLAYYVQFGSYDLKLLKDIWSGEEYFIMYAIPSLFYMITSFIFALVFSNKINYLEVGILSYFSIMGGQILTSILFTVFFKPDFTPTTPIQEPAYSFNLSEFISSTLLMGKHYFIGGSILFFGGAMGKLFGTLIN